MSGRKGGKPGLGDTLTFVVYVSMRTLRTNEGMRYVCSYLLEVS